jgi:hypothetical protein
LAIQGELAPGRGHPCRRLKHVQPPCHLDAHVLAGLLVGVVPAEVPPDVVGHAVELGPVLEREAVPAFDSGHGSAGGFGASDDGLGFGQQGLGSFDGHRDVPSFQNGCVF